MLLAVAASQNVTFHRGTESAPPWSVSYCTVCRAPESVAHLNLSLGRVRVRLALHQRAKRQISHRASPLTPAIAIRMVLLTHPLPMVFCIHKPAARTLPASLLPTPPPSGGRDGACRLSATAKP